jgi:hypothetical protein
MGDSTKGEIDMSVTNVTDNAATHAADAQPQGATDAARIILSEFRSQGKDFIKGSLGRKEARLVSERVKQRWGIDCSASAVYKAKKEFKDADLKDLDKALSNEIAGTVTNSDDDFSGGDSVKVEDMLKDAGDKSTTGGDSQKVEDMDGSASPLQEKKPFEAMPVDAANDIIEVCLQGVSEAYAAMQKPIAPKSLNAVTVSYQKTMEAYNASLPKWLLPVICIALTLVVFVFPFRKEIRGLLWGDADQATVPPTISQ